MVQELSQEEVFDNDKDPLEALREIRRAEGKDPDEFISDDVITNAGEILEDKESELGQGDDKDEIFDDQKEEELPEKEAASSDNSEGDDDAKPEGDDDSEDDDKTTEKSGGDEEESQEEKTGEEDSEESDNDLSAFTSEVRKFKADGKDYEFTVQEILDQFETVFGKAVNFTQKTQAMAPYRKMISALESEGVTADQLNLAIDALKGNKGAIQELMKANKIEAFDLQEEGDGTENNRYTPKEYGKNDYQMELQDITAAISGDEEYPITVDIIGRQWDQHSKQVFADNPAMIQGLHNDVKSGLYDKVAPVAMKMKVLDGNQKSDIEYYMLAGEQLQKQSTDSESKGNGKSVDDLNKATQDAESKFDQQSSEAKKKRAAGSTGARADRKKGVVDYLDDDDEAFDEWYKNLEASN